MRGSFHAKARIEDSTCWLWDTTDSYWSTVRDGMKAVKLIGGRDGEKALDVWVRGCQVFHIVKYIYICIYFRDRDFDEG